MGAADERGRTWTLLTGHGHVLVEIAKDPDARIRDISPAVDLTERTVQAIVSDLEASGYITGKPSEGGCPGACPRCPLRYLAGKRPTGRRWRS